MSSFSFTHSILAEKRSMLAKHLQVVQILIRHCSFVSLYELSQIQVGDYVILLYQIT